MTIDRDAVEEIFGPGGKLCKIKGHCHIPESEILGEHLLTFSCLTYFPFRKKKKKKCNWLSALT